MSDHQLSQTRLSLRHAATLNKIAEKLGPMPREALQAMTDYGLNDVEIARYYGIDADAISRLRRIFGTVRNLYP
ncbi:hypothetical protein [Sulfitobacter sp.]|uniref:hypothetical protein n=1 Tax=Sulfitobacter sp. TaxID=1903071 RepID=UPI003F6BCF62